MAYVLDDEGEQLAQYDLDEEIYASPPVGATGPGAGLKSRRARRELLAEATASELAELNSLGLDRLSLGAGARRRPIDPPFPPGPDPRAALIGERPKIVFDGYYTRILSTTMEGTRKLVWYLIPQVSNKLPSYRYYKKRNTVFDNFIYEPVDSNDLGKPILATPNDSFNITYILQEIPSYGLGLVPYIYYGQQSNNQTIIGFQYIPVNFVVNGLSVSKYSFVPITPAPCDPCFRPFDPCCKPCPTPCPVPACLPYFRDVTFLYAPVTAPATPPSGTITTYGVTPPTATNVLVFQYPISIFNTDGSTLASTEIAIGTPSGTNVALILPDFNCTYKAQFTVFLRISNLTDTSVPPVPFINYLSGSGYVNSTPALGQLIVFETGPSGSANLIYPEYSLTWSDIRIDPTKTPPPPNNFLVQDPSVPASSSYLYVIPDIKATLTFFIPPPPINPSTGLPYSTNPAQSRLLSVQVSSIFSFVSARVIVSNQC